MTYMHQPKATQPRPVTERENEAVHGLARLHENVFHETVARAEDLRKQEAAYRASLPRDPQEAAAAVLREIKAATDGWPTTLDTVVKSLDALCAIFAEGSVSYDASPATSAAEFLSNLASDAAQRLKRHFDRIEDIARALGSSVPAGSSITAAQPPEDADAFIHSIYQDWQRLRGMIASGSLAEGSEDMRAVTRTMRELEREIGCITPQTPRGWAERISMVAALGLTYDPEDPEDIFADLFNTARDALGDSH